MQLALKLVKLPRQLLLRAWDRRRARSLTERPFAATASRNPLPSDRRDAHLPGLVGARVDHVAQLVALQTAGRL
eukprot:1174313-Prymnesium_polylepis.1